MHKILFICGSARNGNCKQILEKIQSNFWLEYSCDLVYIRDYNLKPCISSTETELNMNNDFVNEDKSSILLDKILTSEIIVLATPNYFYNVSSLTKLLIDKTIIYYDKKELQGKKFIYIYVGGDSEQNTKKYLDNAMYGFTISHELKILGTYAYSAGGIGQFNNPETAENTTEKIISVLKDNLQ